MAQGDVLTQLRRGVIEYCVLALLAREKRYGFDLARGLGDMGALTVSEGTVYPILSRLRRDGKIAASWSESAEGPPRKYYELTDRGRLTLESFSDEWARFRTAVDAVINERNG